MEEGSAAGSVGLREAAERAGVSARTMRRYVLDGTVPASKVVGKHGVEYRVDPAVLDDLVARRGQVGQGSRGQVVAGSLATVDATVATTLSTTVEALERAWQRVAELERENAELRSRLPDPETAKPGLLRRLFGV